MQHLSVQINSVKDIPNMKAFPIVRLAPGTRLLSKAEFHFRSFLLWTYSILWIGALFLISFLWEASAWTKAIPVLILIAGTPSDLFMTYGEYNALWDASNVGTPGGTRATRTDTEEGQP